MSQSSPSPAAETGSAPASSAGSVEQAQVEQPVDRAVLLRAGLEAVRHQRLERVGVRVDRERHVLERARDDRVGERLAGLGLDRVVDDVRRLVGVVGDPLDGGDVALQQVFDDVRMLLEELGAHEQHRRRELAVLPQVGFVDEHVGAGVDDQTRDPRLGQPRAVELALLEQRERLRVLGRGDVHVAAARGVGLVALVGQPAAQRDVLRVAELRRRDRRAREVGGGCRCPRATTSAAPPVAAPAMMRADSPPDWMKVLIDGLGPM